MWEPNKVGAESDAVGDEYVAAFADARASAQAALAIQRTLRDTEWPGDIRVRVRIGLHTGTPSLSPRIDVTGDPVLPKSERTFSRNFRTEVFRVPQLGTYGNSARTSVRGPGINNWDAALFKNFPIFSERTRLQFRWELYNAFNHTQFSAFDTATRFDSQGNQINSRLSEFTAARTPRQMQFALRLTF